MGEPIRIADLARTLVRLSGAAVEHVPIVFTGLRPGEKLCEELFYSSETLLPTPHQKVQRTHSQLAPWPNLSQHLQELGPVILCGSEHSIRAKILDIVPEYSFAPPPEESPVIDEEFVPSITPLSAAAND